MTNSPNRLLLFLGCIVLCLFVGFLGGLATQQGLSEWYTGLAKPSWTPPRDVFAPVWSTLYVLMGVSLYLILVKGGFRTKAFGFFMVQLILNGLWSPFFFAMQNITLALIDIVFLWFFIGAFIAAACSISRAASYLQIPYFLWTTYALCLNFSIWLLNSA